jgi:hypothetical protein
MVPRRRKELLFEVLGAKAPVPWSPPPRDVSGREAAAGAIVAVLLLVVVALGGYYLASRTGENPGPPVLSAERPGHPSTETGRESTPSTGAELATPDRSAPPRPRFAIAVRTIAWSSKAKQETAVAEVTKLVDWLTEKKVPNPRAILLKNADGYVVYVGGADDGAALQKLLDRLKGPMASQYPGAKSYFDSAYIVKDPLG